MAFGPSERDRALYRAAIEYGAKEPHTVTSIGSFAVNKGQPIAEVLDQIATSNPHLFFGTPPKPKCHQQPAARMRKSGNWQ